MPTAACRRRSACRCPAAATTAGRSRSPASTGPAAAHRPSPTAAPGAPACSSRATAPHQAMLGITQLHGPGPHRTTHTPYGTTSRTLPSPVPRTPLERGHRRCARRTAWRAVPFVQPSVQGRRPACTPPLKTRSSPTPIPVSHAGSQGPEATRRHRRLRSPPSLNRQGRRCATPASSGGPPRRHREPRRSRDRHHGPGRHR